jgi:ABC-type transport system involved in cytochrome c biogenesis permease subunit
MMSNFFSRYLPALTIGAALVYLVSVFIPPFDMPGEAQIHAAGRLPVQDGGRIQPLDSKARNTLMIISGRQEFYDDHRKAQPAMKWLLESMSSYAIYHEDLQQARLVRIDSPELRKGMELEERADGVYDFTQLTGKGLSYLIHEAMRVEKEERSQYTANDRQIYAVANQLRNYVELKRNPHRTGESEAYKVFRIDNDQVLNLLRLEPRTGLRYSIEEFAAQWKKIVESSKRAGEMDAKQRDLFDVKILDLRRHLELYLEVAQDLKPQVVPSESKPGEWHSLAEVRESGQDEPAADAFNRMLLAYARHQPEQFNRELANYQQELERTNPAALRQARVEALFNHCAPFYQCMILYVCVFLLALLGFAFRYPPLNWAAFALAVLTLVVHTGAILARMYISGRPPVTNLYSSAVFIGWGCLVLALILEGIYHNGLGNLVGSVMGFATVLIAHHLLSTGGDTLEMLQAVLDTNFWLATHVVCVTMGYTATFVAGALGILFVLLGVLTPRLDRNLFQSLSQMIYGVVCFATLLSFVGTVLGGIWADQSWGRFWGWDPKENGALLIVIWNALILHARWAGMVKQRGMAVLTIIGNMVTLWSWFGTNQLGVGLHAYGFNNTLARVLTAVWGVHLLLILVGLVPMHLWWSVIAQKAAAQDRAKSRKHGEETATPGDYEGEGLLGPATS